MSNLDVLDTIRESFDPQLISALYKNFTDKYIAIQELLDNCVDDLIKGKQLQVNITYCAEDECLEIKNVNGNGMKIEDVKKFFSWGTSGKVDRIGRYGQGGKAALGYLGKGFMIKSHPEGSKDGFYIRVDDWQDRTNGFKEFAVQPFPTTEKRGLVSIEIVGLKKNIDERTLRNNISEIYRPLILNHSVCFVLNGIEVRCKPAVFDMETEKPFNINFEYEGKTYNLAGQYGLVSDSSSPRGGFNIYQFGRRVAKKEYFGLTDPSKKWSAEKLYGELYINFELPLVMNKTDIERESHLWQLIRNILHTEVEPTLKTVVDPRAPSKPEVTSITKISKKIKDADEQIEVGLTNYGPNIIFKVKDLTDGKKDVLINRDHKAYQKWGKSEYGKDLYNVMVYALFDASLQLTKKDASKLIQAFSDSLRRHCDLLK